MLALCREKEEGSHLARVEVFLIRISYAVNMTPVISVKGSTEFNGLIRLMTNGNLYHLDPRTRPYSSHRAAKGPDNPSSLYPVPLTSP